MIKKIETHIAVEELQERGFSKEAAEAIVRHIRGLELEHQVQIIFDPYQVKREYFVYGSLETAAIEEERTVEELLKGVLAIIPFDSGVILKM